MKLYGKNPVLERLKTNPKSIRMIYVQEGHPETGYLRKKAAKWGIPVASVPRSKMIKLGRSLNTQGILVEVEDFPYVPYDELLDMAVAKKYSLLFLDSLTDPQNLGGIMRSAACFGGFAIVLPTHDSAGVTETVLRVACGADNYIKTARVANLNHAIAEAKKAGFWIAGTVPEDGQDIQEVLLPFPLGLVIGSEDRGIRDIIRKNIDVALTIPMSRERLSLNVAHAAAIFCYEITKQKNKAKKN